MRTFKLLSTIIFFASCSGGTKSVDDNKQNVKLLWRNQNFEWITSSVFIKDNIVYFGSFNDTFYSTNLTDGKLKLKFKTGYDPYFLPIINSKKIYFSSFDLNIYCIDTVGNLVWKTQTVDRVKNNLLEDDSSLFVSVRSDGLRAIKKSSGTTVWHLSQKSQSLSTNQPIIFKDIIYVGLWDLDNKVLAIDKNNGEIIWRNSYPKFSSSDPALTPNGLVISIDKYYKGGQVMMLNYNTGKEIWMTPLKCEALFKPYTNNQNTIVSTYDNKVVCLENIDGKIKWILKLQNDENADTRFCAFKQNIYFGTTKRNLYCVDINTGKTVFYESFNYGISEPILDNGKIYFPTGGSEIWTLKE